MAFEISARLLLLKTFASLRARVVPSRELSAKRKIGPVRGPLYMALLVAVDASDFKTQPQ